MRWIIVIPVLHFLKGTSRPFEPVFNKVNSQYGQSWAGLQGLKSDVLSIGTQDRKYSVFSNVVFQMFEMNVWMFELLEQVAIKRLTHLSIVS